MTSRLLAPFLALALLTGFNTATPRFTLKGTVVDASGQPASNAHVWISQERVVRSTVTDTQGTFTFSHVTPGHVEVVALRKGAAMDGLDARIVGNANVRLTLGQPDILPIKVLDQEHEPLPGARIVRMTVNGRFEVLVDDLVQAGFPAERSDNHGMLLVQNLPKNGTVSVVVGCRKYAQNRFPPVPVCAKTLPIILYPGVALRGRITTPAKKPAPHARVSVSRLGVRGLRQFAERLTDPEGFYHVTVPAGHYYVAARLVGYASPEPRQIALGNKQENVLDIQLLPAHTLKGTIVGPHGKPAAGVGVAYIMSGAIREQTITLRDGTYLLHVPPGDGSIRILPPDGFIPEKPVDIPVKLKRPTNALIPPLKLKALPDITGKVLNPDGTPEPNALISSLDLNPPCWTVTKADGSFQIRLPRLPYAHVATFRAEHGRRFLRADFTVSFDKLEPAKVVLHEFSPDLSPASRKRVVNNLDALVGKPAPEWACRKWYNSKSLTLESLRGKVVVLTLWGGFDTMGPGRNRIYELNCLEKVFHDVHNVALIGIHDGSSKPADVKKYIQKYGIRFPVGLDTSTFTTFQVYQTNYIPQTVLIDKKGVLRYYDVNGRLLELIKSLRRE